MPLAQEQAEVHRHPVCKEIDKSRILDSNPIQSTSFYTNMSKVKKKELLRPLFSQKAESKPRSEKLWVSLRESVNKPIVGAASMWLYSTLPLFPLPLALLLALPSAHASLATVEFGCRSFAGPSLHSQGAASSSKSCVLQTALAKLCTPCTPSNDPMRSFGAGGADCIDKSTASAVDASVPTKFGSNEHAPIREDQKKSILQPQHVSACLYMCKLHLFRRFRGCGFCCRRHGLCGSLDISQHTDSHSKSSATSGCLGYVWDKQPLAFPTASALGKAELPSCAQCHFQLCTMSVFGATTHLAIILNQSAGL